MAEQVIQEIEEKIQNKKKLSPALPEEDAPVVNIRNIKMPSPPSYKVGEKVLPSLLKVCQTCFKYETVLCIVSIIVYLAIISTTITSFLLFLVSW